MRAAEHGSGPTFVALVRSELFKIQRQQSTRRLVALPVLGLLVYAALCALSHGPTRGHVLQGALDVLDPLAFVLQLGLGAALVLAAGRTVAQEYQLGTIQVLVGRGVGRVRLLLAELAALTALAAGGLAVGAAAGCLLAVALVPGLAADLHTLPPVFWRDAELDLVATCFSLAACLLLGTFVAALSRSLSVSLAMSVAWLPFGNLLVLLIGLVVAVTNLDWLRQVTAYLLSANLNVLPQALAPWRQVPVFLATPLVDVGSAHVVAVTVGWLALFLGGSILLTWRRDVTH
jgi:ABC-2 type transport system permease protein